MMTKWHRTNEPVFNKLCCTSIPLSNSFWPGLTPFGPLFWQAEAYAEMTKPASPTTAVGQKALALAKRCWHAKSRFSTVSRFEVGCVKTFATIQVQLSRLFSIRASITSSDSTFPPLCNSLTKIIILSRMSCVTRYHYKYVILQII